MNSYNQDQSDKYCLFRCCGELLCLPALSVRHVVPQSEITRIPLSTEALAGLVKIQQELLPLFCLDAIYETSKPGAAGDQKVLVVNHDTGAWGLLIDEVETLADLEISICPQTSLAEQANFVIGSATLNDEFVSVIDPENLYSVLTGQLHQYWDHFSATSQSNEADESLVPSA